MSDRARAFRSRTFARQGRKTFWFTGGFTRTAVAGGAAVLILSLNAAALALRPFTIVRTRGIWGIASDQVAATEFQEAAVGEILVTDQALAIGVTAVPTPVSDSGSSWFAYNSLVSSFAFSSGVGFDSQAMQTQVIDSKAMRKVEEGYQPIVVVGASSISDGLTLTHFSKLLIKLH